MGPKNGIDVTSESKTESNASDDREAEMASDRNKPMVQKKSKFRKLNETLRFLYLGSKKECSGRSSICKNSLSVFLVIVNGLGMDNNTHNPRTKDLKKLPWSKKESKEGDQKRYEPVDIHDPAVLELAQDLILRSQNSSSQNRAKPESLMRLFLGSMLNVENSILFGLNLFRRFMKDHRNIYGGDLTRQGVLQELQNKFFDRITQIKKVNEKRKRVILGRMHHLEKELKKPSLNIKYPMGGGKQGSMSREVAKRQISKMKREVSELKVDHVALLWSLLKEGDKPLLKDVRSFLEIYLRKGRADFKQNVNSSYKSINKTRITDIVNLTKSLETVKSNDMNKICKLLYLMIKNNDLLRPLSEFEVTDAITKMKAIVDVIDEHKEGVKGLRRKIDAKMGDLQDEAGKIEEGFGGDLKVRGFSVGLSNNEDESKKYLSARRKQKPLEYENSKGTEMRIRGTRFLNEKDDPKWDPTRQIRLDCQDRKKRGISKRRKNKKRKPKNYL